MTKKMLKMIIEQTAVLLSASVVSLSCALPILFSEFCVFCEKLSTTIGDSSPAKAGEDDKL